jgi:hypothetical protein
MKIFRSILVLGVATFAAVPLPAQVICAKHPPANGNLTAQLARFKRVEMPAATAGLSAKEKRLVQKLVDASRYLEMIFWRQNDKAGLELYKGLAGCTSTADRNLRRFLVINGNHFDLLDEHKSFVGNDPYPPGHENFPKDITQKEIDNYVAAHPDKKADIYNPFTVIKRQGSDLVAVPYHVEYKEWLVPAAQALRDAAALSDDKAFANFLRIRADALLTD